MALTKDMVVCGAFGGRLLPEEGAFCMSFEREGRV